jgi:hypothetical protein
MTQKINKIDKSLSENDKELLQPFISYNTDVAMHRPKDLVTIKTNILLHYMSKIHQNTHRIVLKCQ